MSDTPTRHKPAWGIDYAIVFATAGSNDSGTGPEAQIRRLVSHLCQLPACVAVLVQQFSG
ncbi:hypothetical protein TWF970_007588 [Orbilia oligospora]|uniref:Uncharacterized protein n=1 Tax=Orbilia oligospora TaxID=2813651 RepID=A0A7C8RA58_ORBOL|nr:hypothetical protein TWF970_007588 [Orbilia oligospora]